MNRKELLAEVQRFTPAMRELGIYPPDLDDRADIRRALLQLRQRLVVDLEETEEGLVPAYKHRTNLGTIPAYVDEIAALQPAAEAATDADLEALESGSHVFTQPFRAELAAFLADLEPWRRDYWKANPEHLLYTLLKLQKGSYNHEHVDSIHARLARLNPLPEGADEALDTYLRTGEEPERLKLALLKRQKEAQELGLTPDRVGAIFPREGTLQRPDSWDPKERIPSALSHYDLISQVDTEEPPENVVAAMQEGKSPFDDQAALDYLIEASGLSLAEAKRVLREMKRSAEGRKGRDGKRIAMQPSSAMCKLHRRKKLASYHPPRQLFEKVGNHAVVILMSPPDETPRVMTWRRGSHLDCDMVADRPEGLLQAFSRALQSAVFWVAEKPGRAAKTKIYTGHVGGTGLYLVWKPGDPISLDTVAANLKQQQLVSYQTAAEGQRDVQAYNAALGKTFGTRLTPPSPRTPRQRKERAPRAARRTVAASPANIEEQLRRMKNRELKSLLIDENVPNRSKLKSKEAMVEGLLRHRGQAPSAPSGAPAAASSSLAPGEPQLGDSPGVEPTPRRPRSSRAIALDAMRAATGTEKLAAPEEGLVGRLVGNLTERMASFADPFDLDEDD